MTMRHRLRSGSARRGFATITSAALLLSMMAVPASATHFENTDVLDADNAVEAGVNWSEFTFDSATDVALGRNDKFPDNLASSVIQGTDTPLLYTDGASLSEETAAELDRLGAETIHVLGGEAAISEDVVDELEALGYETHRDAGETRIETALDIAATHAADATHGLVVRAFGDAQGDETRAWADALAAGGWAAEEGWPVFLTQTEELNDNVAAYLEDSAIESVTIIGGTSAVSAAVASDLEALGIEVDRVSGVNRFATAVAIAAARGFADAGDADTVILSEGQQSDAWAGGFAAAAFSAISGAPIVLSNGENIPPETEEWLEGANGDGTVALVCGPFVEPEACDEAATILGQEHAPHTNQAYTATPTAAATNDTSTGSGDTANRGSLTYTVSGLGSTPVNIALFPCANVTQDGENTEFTRSGSTPNEIAAGIGGNTNAVIEVVNGVAVAAGQKHVGDDENAVTPNNGAITFTVDSLSFDCVTPVVFNDADNDSQLDVDAEGQPEEDFATGGQKTWVPAEAADGSAALANQAVQYVDKDDNFFVANNQRYNYDEGDVYTYDQAPDGGAFQAITFAQWETAVSVGDLVDSTGTYSRNFQNQFGIDADTPGTPTNLVGTAGDWDADANDTNSDDLRFTWDAPSPANGLIADYTVTVYDDDPAVAGCQTTTPVGTATSTGTATTVDVEELANDTYCATVVANSQAGQASPASTAAFNTVQVGAVDATAPTITDARVNEAGGVNLTQYDTGDIIQLTFSERMADGDVGSWVFIVTDTDGDRYQISCAGNNTCVLNSGNNATVDDDVLTITSTGAQTDLNNGTGDDVAGIPATIVTTSTNVDDPAGNSVSVANSSDVVIDNEGVLVADTAAPVAQSAKFVNAAGVAADFDGAGDTITVVYNETMDAPVNGDTVTAGGVTMTCGTNVTCTLATTTSTNDSLVLTWALNTADLVAAAGKSVTASTGITDVAGNNATGYPVTIS